MAFGNTSYGDFDASDASVAASGLAYAVEAQLSNTWQTEFLQSHPTLGAIFKGGDKATSVGPKLLFPIWLANGTAVTGVLRADEDTTTFTPDGGQGSQAELQWTRYVANQGVTLTQLKEYANSEKTRGSLVKGRAAELNESFMLKLETDMMTSQDAAQNIILGIPFALVGSSGANTLHNVNRATSGNENFRANITATVGVLTEERLDGDIETLFREKNSKPDLIIAAKSSTIDIYSKIKTFLRGNELVTRNVNDDGKKYRAGYTSVEYRGLELIRDHLAPSGETYILDSKTWGWWGDQAPSAVNKTPNRIDKTLYFEMMYQMACALYCQSPRSNWRYTGVTG